MILRRQERFFFLRSRMEAAAAKLKRQHGSKHLRRIWRKWFRWWESHR